MGRPPKYPPEQCRFGVYAIINQIIDTRYIGLAQRSFGRRWHLHITQLTQGTHHCKPLQKDWFLYGSTKFHFTILESFDQCPKSGIAAIEGAWVDACRKVGIALYNVAPTSSIWYEDDGKTWHQEMRSITLKNLN